MSKQMIEPPIGSVVLDASGSAWQRHPNGWSIAGGDDSWNYTWKQLLVDLYTRTNDSPTQTWQPVLDKLGRYPRILFIPGEELIEEKDDGQE
jgi:hypothetical protein